jgi:hypothetical protein
MFAISSVVVVLLVLGVAFLGVARFSPPSARDRRLWATALIVTLGVTLGVAAFAGDLHILLNPTKRLLHELVIMYVVVWGLMAEAVLVSRWAFDRRGLRNASSFLAAFTIGTVTVWFLTALCLWAFIPWV